MEQIRELVTKIEDYPDSFSSRGIVICADGKKYFHSAILVLEALRLSGCTLPVEWFYIGDEISPDQELYVNQLFPVNFIDALKIKKLYGVDRITSKDLKGFMIKAFS